MIENNWYMLNSIGMATHCVDKADADQHAHDADALWPHLGPHRAVQLVESTPLTAAAPDLLSALRGLLAVVYVRIDDPRCAQFDAASAAVAKAECGAA